MFGKRLNSDRTAKQMHGGEDQPLKCRQLRAFVFTLFIFTLTVQFYAMLGARILKDIDGAAGQRAETHDIMGRLESQDPSLLKTTDADIAEKSIAYAQLRWKLKAIDRQQNEAFTSLYQWNALWAAPVGWLHSQGAAGLWGADSADSGNPGRIHYGTETIARTLLDVLQGMILPMLYASLGAWVRLIRERRNLALAGDTSAAAAIDVREPLMLGAIVGSVLGFFHTADVLGAQVKTIPLIGLSFLAGYSIDWLFGRLDRLAAGKASDDARQGKAETPATPYPLAVR